MSWSFVWVIKINLGYVWLLEPGQDKKVHDEKSFEEMPDKIRLDICVD